MTDHDLVTASEAATILKVTPRTIARRVASGALTAAHKLPGERGAFLFRRADVEDLLTEPESAA